MATKRGGRDDEPVVRPGSAAAQYPAPTVSYPRPVVGPQWNNQAALRAAMARSTAQYAIEAQAQILSDSDLEMIRSWAAKAPTVDPRTAVSLAFARIEPESEDGQSVAMADIAARLQDGTYVNTVGTPGDGVTRYDGPAQVAKPDDHTIEPEQSWWQTALDNVVPDPDNEFWDNVMPDADTTVGGMFKGLDPVQKASRWTLALGQSALDFVEGGFRSSFGDYSKIAQLQDKHGLSDEDRDLALNYDGVWGSDTQWSEVAAMDIPGVTSFKDLDADQQSRIKRFLDDYRTAGTVGAPGEGTGDMRARMLAGESVMDQIGPQTAIGQAAADPDIINADQGSWLPSAEIEQRKEVAALEAFDIRTAEEILRGVEPTAWTPGRGIAHMQWSPDQEAFHTWSGVIDFGKSVALDPVNYIPMGAAGKAATAALALNKGSKASLKAAIAGKGGKIVVATDINASQGAAASRRGAANVAAAKAAGAEVEQDVLFQTRNVTYYADGRIRTPHGQFLSNKQAWAWLNSGKGQRVTDDLAGRTSAYDIWKRSGGERGGMSWELAEQLSKAQTPAAVRAILGSRIGAEIDSAGQLTRFGSSPVRMKIVDSAAGTRVGKFVDRQLAVAARGNVISVHDSDVLVREIDSFATAAKLDHATKMDAIDKIMAAPSGAARYDAIYNEFFSGVVKTHLVDSGVDEEIARIVTTAYKGGFDQAQREYWTRGVAFGGGDSTGHPTLMNEALSDLISLPSYRELLRASSAASSIRKKLVGQKGSDATGDFLQNVTSEWRNLVLLRPAYVLREVGEMSFSMALSGYDSIFTHPLQVIAMATHVAALNASKTMMGDLMKTMASGATDPKVSNQFRNNVANAHGKMLAGEYVTGLGSYAKYGVQKSVYEASTLPMKAFNAVLHLKGMQAFAPYIDPTMARVNGEGMFEELVRFQETGDPQHLTRIADAMSVTHGNFIQDMQSKTFGQKVDLVRRPDLDPKFAQDYAAAVADRLRRGSEDPEIKNIAQTAVDPNWTMADVEAAYVAGTRNQKHQMFKNTRGMQEWADPKVKTDLDYLIAQEEVLRGLTGSDTDLITAVHRGTYNGKPIGSDNAEFVAKVRQVVEGNPSAFPEEMGVVRPGYGASVKWNQITSDFFQNTAAFSDVFARGPIVRQAYVKRVLELGSDMSPAAKAQIVKNLRQAGDIALARKVQQVKATGGLTIEEVEGIAAGFATKEVQRIFYDASKRQNWALAMRVASPFAQATMNTFKRWGLMSMQNPQSYYRAMKPLVALEQPGSAVLYDIIGGMTGDPSMEQYFDAAQPSMSPAGGFFFSDRYGEKKFAYPLVGPIAKLLGAPDGIVGLGSLENLNVAGTSFNPGFGPSITLAASFGLGDVIDDKSFAGDVVRALWPYGLPEEDNGWVSQIINSTLPTAYKKAEQALTADSPQRMNTAVANLSGLINSGDYDMSDTSDVARLMNDADELSKRLGVWAAVFGAMTPSTFTPSTLVEIKSPEGQEGAVRWMMVDRLMEEYQKYTKDDYQNGTLNFVNDFGGTALFSALPRTRTDAIAQATNDMWQFKTDNPDSYKENIEVIGLFMSNDDLGSNFARELFLSQRKEGTRGYQKLTGPDSYSEKVNEAIGWMLWNKATADIDKQVGDDEKARARLRALVSDDLVQKYPGFSPSAKDTGRNVELIAKIRDALDDPGVQSLPSTYYVDRYLRQRDAALKAMRGTLDDPLPGDEGANSLSVKAASKVARQLWLIGQQYANEDTSGGFRHMWNRVLSQELDPYGNPASEQEESK